MRLSPDQQRLAAEWLPFALRVAAAAGRRRPEMRDQFLSDAGAAVVRAARDFDPARGVPHRAYLRMRLRAQFFHSLERANPRAFCHRNGRSGVRRWYALWGGLEAFDPALAREEVGYEAVDQIDQVRGMVAALSPRRRRLLAAFYGGPHRTILSAGLACGVTREVAYWTHERALGDLRRRAGSDPQREEARPC